MNTTLQIRDRAIGEGFPPFIIAEMACAHDGDMDKAKRLIDATADAGADAIQLQVFDRDQQVPPSHKIYDLLGKIQFRAQQWRELFDYAKREHPQLIRMVFTYDPPSFALAQECGMEGIKLSSADLANPEMLRICGESGLPVTLGTGASTMEEIAEGLRTLSLAGKQKSGGEMLGGLGGLGGGVILMHGVQNFPTALEHANLRHITLLQESFGLPVGYQDHTDASLPEAPFPDLVALGLGACALEKHITWDRSEKGTDHQAALEPAEFKEYVRRIRELTPALGTSRVEPLRENDHQYRAFQKRCVMATAPIAKGEPILREKTAFLRTEQGGGLPPADFLKIENPVASRDISPYEQILTQDIG